MSTNTTRRAILAGAAVLPALTIPASAGFAAQAHADADLFALVDRYFDARDARDAAGDELDRVVDVAYPRPPRPEVLRITKEDERLRLPVPEGTAFTHWNLDVNIDQLRKERWWSARRELVETAEHFGYVEHMVIPTPEARARADQIIAAFDAWQAEWPKPTPDQERAVQAAEQRYADGGSEVFSLEDQISDTPAHTLAGLIAKARVALDGDSKTDSDELALDSPVAESVIRDLLELEGGTSAAA